MMYYAAENKLSTSPIEGGIQISAEEYSAALSGLLEGKRVSVEDGQLVVAFPPEPEPEPEPEPTPPTKEDLQEMRQSAFQSEADPLFFKWQAGEGTEQEWLAKREEIRARYPYPEE